MNQGRTVFSQLLSFLPDREFRRCVARYGGDARPRGFSCWDHYLSMAFAQLTYRDGLRDIEACLRSLGGKLYHMGFHGRVAPSTLADANDSHDWRIYADFAQVLIRLARPLYAADPIGVDLDQSLYALDSTTIDLCLSLFPWAKFRKHKAAVKMHTLLDLHGNIPPPTHKRTAGLQLGVKELALGRFPLVRAQPFPVYSGDVESPRIAVRPSRGDLPRCLHHAGDSDPCSGSAVAARQEAYLTDVPASRPAPPQGELSGPTRRIPLFHLPYG
jgi:hypothetical protein